MRSKKNILGKNIRMGIIAAGLDEEKFAKKVGVSKKMVDSWEAGASIPNCNNANASGQRATT